MKIKQQIIAFLLMLVLVFGCLPTSVLAVESSEGQSEAEAQSTSAHNHDYANSDIDKNADGFCDTCVAKQLKTQGNGVISPDALDSYLSADGGNIEFANVLNTTETKFGFTTLNNSENRYVPVTEENGNVYLNLLGKDKAEHTKSAYFDMLTSYSSATNVTNSLASREGKKSAVISLDLKFHGTLNASVFLFTLMFYSQNKNTAQNANPTSTSDIEALQIKLIRIDKNGYLEYRDAETGDYVKSKAALSTEEFKAVAVHIRPEDGEFGLYDLYVGGESIEKNIRLLTDSEQQATTWTYTKKDGSAVESFGAKSLLVGRVRTVCIYSDTSLYRSGKDLTLPTLSIDNPKVYFSEPFIECATHDFKAVKHDHSPDTDEIIATFACHCGVTQEVKLPLDTVAAGTCDTCGLKIKEYGKSGIIHPNALSTYIKENEIITSTTITDTSKYGFSSTDDESDRITLGKSGEGENENYYLEFKGKSADHKKANVESETAFATAARTLYYFNKELTTNSFVISADVKLHCELNKTFPIFTLYSYMTKKTEAPTSKDDLTYTRFVLIRASTSGLLQYRNGDTYESLTDVNLIKDDFTSVSVHVRPGDGDYGLYDIYVDGAPVRKDIVFLTAEENEGMTWTYAGEENSKYPDHMKKGQTVNGAKDYRLSSVAYGTILNGDSQTSYSKNGNVDDTVLSLDNVKLYYSENYIEYVKHTYNIKEHRHSEIVEKRIDVYECTHCNIVYEKALPLDKDENGFCDGCGEKVGVGATVLARQVSLDERMGLKLLVKINSVDITNPQNKAFLTIGDRTETILIKDLTPNYAGLYVIEVKLTSIEMAEDVSIAFEIDGVLGDTYTTSVKAYAQKLIDNSTQTQNTRALAKAMLNYGAYSQQYFANLNNDAGIAEKLANEGLTEADRSVAHVDSELLSEYEFVGETTTLGSAFTGASLVLADTISMKIFFKFNGNFAVTVDGQEAVATPSDGEYYVVIKDIFAANLSKNHTITVTSKTDTLSASVSVFSCIKALLDSNVSDTFKDLGRAIYLYGLASKNYIENKDITMINLNTEWKYLDDNTDPAAGLDSLTDWTEEDFDDSSWKTGIGSFGAKNGTIGTINGKKPNVLLDMYDADEKTYPTYFFRTTVNINNVDDYNTIDITTEYDDAIVIYINGKKIVDTRTSTSTTTNLYYSSTTGEKSFQIDLNEHVPFIKNGKNTIAVELHNNSKTSTDIYFEITDLTLSYRPVTPVASEYVVLSFGEDETKRNLAWFSNIRSAGEVRLAEASLVNNGVFPSEYRSFNATATPDEYTNGYKLVKKATIDGLKANTRYAYVIAADGVVSEIYYFETGSFDDFEFVFIGDPQLKNQDHAEKWYDTIDKVKNKNYLNADLLISAGDQVEEKDSTSLFNAFISDVLTDITFAPTVGPGHESPSTLFAEHYNLPNLSTKYGATSTSADYWYVYNNTLFMHLNNSDSNANTNGEHVKFMEEAIAANPNVTWKIVVMHYSLYSTAWHAESAGTKYIDALAPAFTECGIDLVLSGHDHVYVRTKVMNGKEISTTDVIENGKVTNPNGTVYICANSSTGTKFYDKSLTDTDFVDFENYEERKSAIKFEVTDTSITMTTYFLDDMSIMDTFTIEKTAQEEALDLAA